MLYTTPKEILTYYFIPDVFTNVNHDVEYYYTETIGKILRITSNIYIIMRWIMADNNLKIFKFIKLINTKVDNYFDTTFKKILLVIGSVVILIIYNIIFSIVSKYFLSYGKIIMIGYPVKSITKTTSISKYYHVNRDIVSKALRDNLCLSPGDHGNLVREYTEFIQGYQSNTTATLCLTGNYGVGKTKIARIIASMIGGFEINLNRVMLLKEDGRVILNDTINYAIKNNKVLIFDNSELTLLSRTMINNIIDDADPDLQSLSMILTTILSTTSLLPVIFTINLSNELEIDYAMRRRITNFCYIPSLNTKIYHHNLLAQLLCNHKLQTNLIDNNWIDEYPMLTPADWYNIITQAKVYLKTESIISTCSLRKLTNMYAQKLSQGSQDQVISLNKYINTLNLSVK